MSIAYEIYFISQQEISLETYIHTSSHRYYKKWNLNGTHDICKFLVIDHFYTWIIFHEK